MKKQLPYAPRPDGFHARLGDYAPVGRNLGAAAREEVRRALQKPRLNERDFALLLSPAAGEELERMAQRASAETLRHFGKARQLFAPLYLANYCTNRCVYCGFHAGQAIERRALSPEAIEEEAKALAATGLRRVLALTGDAPRRTGAAYIAEGVAVLARHFPSVGIEVQALTGAEYALVARAGADSMTMFQETYDPELYARLHLAGPKRDFAFRLDAPHRAAEAGMRGITLGALLGLGDWRFDIFMLGMHGQWLQRLFPQLELAFSLPRIRPRSEEETRNDVGKDKGQSIFEPRIVTDREFVQALTALRCFMPHAGITLSTRERAFLRDKLLNIGVTKLSAGVCTAVGGYSDRTERTATDAVQFVIDDERSVPHMVADLERLGFQPVFADWLLPEDGGMPLAEALRRSLGGVAATQGTA
ncbi:MAG: 2-iminoacetate synthase ThiH [Desulfovibrionaceae bacterium]|nr:2-iminoacetate synthase ThiH [Desulfovibrionaceae bacterium]